MKLSFFKTLSPTRSLGSASLIALLGLWLVLGTGCASLKPGFETPSVSVTNFRMLSSDGLVPQFEIALRVVNPNADKLSLRGMNYKIFLNNHDVVQGAANDLPVVQGYSEAEFKVNASVGLFEGLRFVNNLMKSSAGQVDYRVQANLDVGAMLPMVRIEKNGKFVP